jgi:hypothetical protein
MDFEKYIGKDRQLLDSLDSARSDAAAYEKHGNAGSLDIAEDDIKLLKTGNYVKACQESAEASAKDLDVKLSMLKGSQKELELKNAGAVLKIIEWEDSFDQKYKDMSGRIEEEMKALERSNKEFSALVKAQDDLYKKRSQELTTKVEEAGRKLKESGDRSNAEIMKLSGSLKDAQKEFESSINEKLEQDKQTIDRIKYMLSTMSDIIKV